MPGYLERYGNPNTQSKQELWNTRLCEFAKRNQVEFVERALNNGADPNVTYVNDESIFWYTLRRRTHKKTTKLLIERGADLNKKGQYDWTPLLRTVANKRLGLVRTLVNNGANINTFDGEPYCLSKLVGDSYYSSNLTKLGYKDKHYKLYEFLIEKGARIDHVDANGMTVLMNAVKSNNHKIVRSLLKKGVDTTIKCEWNGTALNYTALHTKFESGKEHKVLLSLLDHGVDKESLRKTLMHALNCENEAVVRILILYGTEGVSMDFRAKLASETNVSAMMSRAARIQIKYPFLHDIYPIFPIVLKYPKGNVMSGCNGILLQRPGMGCRQPYSVKDHLLYCKHQDALLKERPIFTLKVLTIRLLHIARPKYYNEIKKVFPYLFIVHPGQFTKWKIPTNKVKLNKL